MSDTEPDNRREVIEAAFDAAEPDAAPVDAPDSTESSPAPSEPTPTVPGVPDAAEKPSSTRSRDQTGKFAKGTATKALSVVPGTGDATAPSVQGKASATPAPSAATPTPTVKAPQSWTPAAREEWAKVPQAVQQEINRREREVATSMQQTAQVRQQWSQFERTVSPYVGNIQAEGGDVMATIGSLLQTATALRTAPPQHKAQLVANLCHTFSIPIELLDQALAGQPMPQQSQQQHFDPRQIVSQAKQELRQEFQQERFQSLSKNATAELEEFAEAHEFLPDVRETMADLIETAARRGLTLSYEDAYHRACSFDSGISKVLEQRKAASQANASQASTQRALRASSSIRSQPTVSISGDGPVSRRDEVSAAFDKLVGR